MHTSGAKCTSFVSVHWGASSSTAQADTTSAGAYEVALVFDCLLPPGEGVYASYATNTGRNLDRCVARKSTKLELLTGNVVAARWELRRVLHEFMIVEEKDTGF